MTAVPVRLQRLKTAWSLVALKRTMLILVSIQIVLSFCLVIRVRKMEVEVGVCMNLKISNIIFSEIGTNT